MATRRRPADCCETPIEYAPLSAEERGETVALFKALGDGTRLEIFRLIASQHSAVCVCDITDRFAFSQPTISHHLRILREAGLVDVSRRGNWAYYTADTRALRSLGPLAGMLELPGSLPVT